MNDLDRLRATTALEDIQGLKSQGYDYYGNYVSFVKALPATILQIGLGQALATELAASGKENETQRGHKCLFNSINQWLGRNDDIAPYSKVHNNKPEKLLEALMKGKQERYIYAQQEALAYLDWLKKFAVAMLDAEKPSNNQRA